MLPYRAQSIRCINALLVAVIVVFAAAAAYTSYTVLERQQALQRAARYDVAFSASQAGNEFLRLMQRIAAIGSGGTESSVDEVELRFAIVLNRLSLLHGGDFRRFVEESPERRTLLGEFAEALELAEPLIARVEDDGARRRLIELLLPFEAPIIGLASEANEYGGRAVADDHRQLLRLHWRFSALAAGLAVAGLLLVALLVWSNRLLRRTRRQLQRTFQDLRERKAALTAQNTRFEAALGNMSQGLCMIDAHDRLTVANPRFFELFGIPSLSLEGGTSMEAVVAAIGDAKRPSEGASAIHARNASNGREPHLLKLGDGSILQVLESPMGCGGRLLTYEDVTERVRAQEHVEYLARHDSLTGLANRMVLDESLERALYRMHRRGERFAAHCLDLDRFKGINDTLGHRVGDGMLQQVAERLRAATRDEDLVARISGDEFVILQCGARNAEDAALLAQRVVADLSRPYTVDEHQIIIGTSIGIALAPQNGSDPEQLLQNADLALYRAKANGRGSYAFFDESLHAKVQARRDIERELRRASFDEEFEILYQQQVDVQSHRLIGVEALLRWRNPRLGQVSPEDFIPVAEEMGLIVPLGAWALKTACREVAGWSEAPRLAVNVSPVQFRRGDLVEAVRAALRLSGMPPQQLELEITESLFVSEDEGTAKVMGSLCEIGVTFSLDDFGTGYSSLSYVRRFPISKIKIDQSFIRNLPDNPGNLEIVRAIAALAGSLGLSTTAEGVETREELDLLAMAGCTEAQGYYFARPLRGAEMRDLLGLHQLRAGASAA
ncbi:MAG TPA: EAL domain-containing protein [Afifellaceae bacterium]|nr:EAL domain-containing protein [Afifellaceae bacterium]